MGLCDDERNTAYAGPDADNTCKIPFFYNGVWFENCTLYPHDTFWCPTEVDEKTREMDGKYYLLNNNNNNNNNRSTELWLLSRPPDT